MRVLVVEDEVILAKAVQSGLQRAGMAVDVVHDGVSALDQLHVNAYDVALLDRDLPGVHGDDLCRTIITKFPRCRVVMLTAARRLDDKVAGLGIGADDYLTKPFEFPELVARIRAVSRRTTATVPPVLEFGDLRLDPFQREVHRDNKSVQLARKEFAVLELLMRAGGGVVSTEELLEKAWDMNADPFTNAVRITMSTLRAKLGAPPVIQTVTGVGYRMAITER